MKNTLTKSGVNADTVANNQAMDRGSPIKPIKEIKKRIAQPH
ncbi:MAG: hypothetical protein ACO3MV_05555 [Flavobacteriales bacterium]